MTSKLIKWIYTKFIYKKLEQYVKSTENEWDDEVLKFIDEVVDLLLLKIDDTIDEIDKIK